MYIKQKDYMVLEVLLILPHYEDAMRDEYVQIKCKMFTLNDVLAEWQNKKGCKLHEATRFWLNFILSFSIECVCVASFLQMCSTASLSYF